MSRNFFLISLLLLSTVVFLAFKSASPKQKIIVIDPGHGGKDTGAIGSKSKEKDVVLAIALKLGNYIEQNMPEIKVIYTRKTDIFITLRERASIANKNNADLFISIHANSTHNAKAYGTETFVMGLQKTDDNLEVAKLENSVITYEDDYESSYEGFDPHSAESYIIFSLMQNAYLEQSLNLAAYIQKEFKEKAKRYDRGVKQAPFLVLWRTTMPSVLVETGFISNPKEEAYLTSEGGQSYVSSAIYRSVKNYFKKIDEDEQEIKKLNKEQKIKKIDEQKKNEVVFRIQILTSSKQIDVKTNDELKKYADVFEYKEGKWYKYTVGNHKNLKDAKEALKKLKNNYKDAFIVAFRGDKKVALKEALKNN